MGVTYHQDSSIIYHLTFILVSNWLKQAHTLTAFASFFDMQINTLMSLKQSIILPEHLWFVQTT